MTDEPIPHGLGWLPSPDDARDWPVAEAYAATGRDAPPEDALPGAFHVPAPLYPVLDQGSSPMCVAYSAAGEQGWYDLRDTGLALFDEPSFFRAIGGTANGALIRNALAYRLGQGYPVDGHAELAGKHRIAAYYAVPVTRADLCAAISTFGPIVIGTPWANSWFRPVSGVLPPYDYASGGHAIQGVGWDATGLRLRNSWGVDWGQSGEATLPWNQIGTLREAWKALDVIDVQLFRVSVAQSTPLYDRPGGTVVGHVTLATYTCARSMSGGKWWYRIVNAGTNRGRYMPAEPWMVVR